MTQFIQDSGDHFDKVKWDFYEGNIPVYIIGKYQYKARSKESANKLATIRNKIDILCQNIINYLPKKEHYAGVDVFLGLHCETYYDPRVLPFPFSEIAQKGQSVSRYLLSEIPKGTDYFGLNKPRLRYIDNNSPIVGKDQRGRALYRDIFLNLDRNDKDLEELVIHELAHSMANHIAYRPDDHHADFKQAEKLITKYWPT